MSERSHAGCLLQRAPLRTAPSRLARAPGPFLAGYERVAESRRRCSSISINTMLWIRTSSAPSSRCAARPETVAGTKSMTATAEAFDNHLEQWIKEQGMPWGILRYKQAQANLAKHIGSGPLHILDAGGGNGPDRCRWQGKAISSRLSTTRSKCSAMRYAAPRRPIFRHVSPCIRPTCRKWAICFLARILTSCYATWFAKSL